MLNFFFLQVSGSNKSAKCCVCPQEIIQSTILCNSYALFLSLTTQGLGTWVGLVHGKLRCHVYFVLQKFNAKGKNFYPQFSGKKNHSFFFSLFFLYFKIMRAVLVKQPGKDITDIKYIPVDASCHLR